MLIRFCYPSTRRHRVLVTRLAMRTIAPIDVTSFLTKNGLDVVPMLDNPECQRLMEDFEPWGTLDVSPISDPEMWLTTASFVLDPQRRFAFCIRCGRELRQFGYITDEDEYIVSVERCPRAVWKYVTDDELRLELHLIHLFTQVGARVLPRTWTDHFQLTIDSICV